MKTLAHIVLLFALAAGNPACAAQAVPVTGPAVQGGGTTAGQAGRAVPGPAADCLKTFDDAVLRFMETYRIQGGTLAVSKDGKILLERGYGWADQARVRPMPPEALLRIASVSKPITRAAVLKLARQDKFTPDTKVFDYLGLAPPQGQWGDDRLHQVTIRQLLDHRGGWDHAEWGDPMFQARRIREELKLSAAPTPADVVRWMLGKPLQFDPGRREAYSNFGYCVLGRVIEKASGRTYEKYVQDEILRPAGANDTRMSRDRAADRDPREVWYPAADGAFSVEMMDAHGGLASTAADLSRFLHAYWISGEPRRPGQRASYIFFGSLPGTTAMAMQRPSGVDIAALFNGPPPDSKDRDACLKPLADAMAKAAAQCLEQPLAPIGP